MKIIVFVTFLLHNINYKYSETLQAHTKEDIVIKKETYYNRFQS